MKKQTITNSLLMVLGLGHTDVADVKYIYRKNMRGYILCHTDGTYSSNYASRTTLANAKNSVTYNF